MDEGRERWAHLATRIPRSLHRTLKLHCVERDMQIMDFVVAALEEKLRREAGEGKRRGSR